MLAQQEGRLQSAEKLYLEILAYRPHYQDSRINLSAIYLDQGRAAEAGIPETEGPAGKSGPAQAEISPPRAGCRFSRKVPSPAPVNAKTGIE